MQVLEEERLYSNFINSLKSEETKKNYSYNLKKYMAYNSMTKCSDLLLADREEKIKRYVIYLQNKGVSKSEFKILLAALKNFNQKNDIEDIQWRKLKRFMGE